MFRAPFRIGSAGQGHVNFRPCEGFAPIKRLGMTPTTVNTVLSIVSLRPTTSGARLNQLSQKCSLITTPNPAGLPASLVVLRRSVSRPSSGAVSSAGKNPPLT